MISPQIKTITIQILKALKLYEFVRNVAKNCRFFRVILKSRFATLEYRYTNFQTKPNKKIVCVIVSCCNYLEYTKQALNSYYAALDSDYNYILIVMDDHSTGQTKSFFSEDLKKLTNICYFRYRKNRGLTQTWNDGVLFVLKKIKADYVFLINNDTIIPKNTFHKMLAHLESHKEAGAIGPLTNCPGFQPRQDIREFYPAYAASDLQLDIQAAADIIKENKPVEVGYINGFFMGFSREAFEKNVHSYFLSKPYYFNPLNRNTGNEDEFLLRLKQAGFKILMATDVFVFHYKDISQHRFTKGEMVLFRKGKDTLKRNLKGE